MLTEFTSSTPIWMYIEYWLQEQKKKRGEKTATGRISYCLSQGGVTNMERLNSMTEKEILSIPDINKANYRCIKEALEIFQEHFGNRVWITPDFDELECSYIIHELIMMKRSAEVRRKPAHYYDLLQTFRNLAQEDNRHPQIKVMERIYYKLDSIHRDEFAAIMTGKNINICDYGI